MSECFLAGLIISRVNWWWDFFIMQYLPAIICLTDRLHEEEKYFSTLTRMQIIDKGFASPTEAEASSSFGGGKPGSAKGIASIDCLISEELPIGNRHSREITQPGSGFITL
jgi:hypothetical protein